MRPSPPSESSPDKVRLDKWLWAARFFKTRGLSADEIGRGRVMVNDQVAKASREVRVADRIELRQGEVRRVIVVVSVDDRRGPAVVAQAMYAETPESIEARQQQVLQRRLNTEPALAIDQGRPTKRDRRELAQWNRWSVSVDPE